MIYHDRDLHFANNRKASQTNILRIEQFFCDLINGIEWIGKEEKRIFLKTG